MARKRDKQLRDKGRGFYETSSPFETYEPGNSKPKTWSGYTDDHPATSTKLINGIAGGEVLSKMQPEQYDNPRGYPGLAMVTTGSQRSKLPMSSKHSIQHHMEGSASLAGTKGRSKD